MNQRLLISKILATGAAGLALLITVVGGLNYPGYSHLADFISELGALGTTTGAWVSYGGFLPIGILAMAFVFVSEPLLAPVGRGRLGFYLLLGIGIGYAGATLAPCDLSCAGTSTRQALHNSLGIFEYLGSGIGLILFANNYFKDGRDPVAKNLLRAAGVLTLLGLILIMVPFNPEHVGLNQRIAETALFGALLLIAWRVLPAAANSNC